MPKRAPNKITWLLIAITIIGLFVRLYKVGTLAYPPSGDEIAFGYYGWSLAHFGTDEYGNKFPLYFPSIGDFKFPGLAYLNIIPAKLFGLSIVTIKFWSIVAGTALIPLVYLIVKLVSLNELAAVCSALFMAVNPWGIIMSRGAYESNLALFIFSLGLTFLIYFINTLSYRWYKLALILFLFCLYTYSPLRIFLPILLFAYAGFLFFSGHKGKYPLIFLASLISLVSVLSFIPWQSRSRANGLVQFSLNHDQEQRLLQSTTQAGLSPLNPPIWFTRVWHNQYRVYLSEWLGRYLDYLSPRVLFFDTSPANEKIPEIGVLLLVQAVVLPLGLIGYYLISSPVKPLILLWLLLGHLAASLTVDGPHLTRGLMLLPPLIILSGLGLDFLIKSFKKSSQTILLAISTILIFVNLTFALNQLLVQKPVASPWQSEQGTEEMVKTVIELQPKYQAIVIPDDPYMMFLFYGKISPVKFIQNSDILPLTKNNPWKRVNRLENIIFNMPYECPKSGKISTLYVCRGTNIPQNAKIIKVINFLDGLPRYTLLEFYPSSQIPQKLPDLPDRLHYMVELETKYKDGLIPSNSVDYW